MTFVTSKILVTTRIHCIGNNAGLWPSLKDKHSNVRTFCQAVGDHEASRTAFLSS